MANNRQPYRAAGNSANDAYGRNEADAYDEYEGYDDEYDDNEDYDYYDDELSRKRANRGCLIAFLVFVAAVVIVFLIGLFWVLGEVGGKNATAVEPVTIEITTNSGSAIGSQLEEAGLISNSNIFRFYMRFNGSSTGIQRGRFVITPGMSYDEIIETISQPPPERETVKVTIPEGSTVMQFASRLEKKDVCKAEDFIKAANAIASEEIAKGEDSDFKFFGHIQLDPNTWMAAEGYLAANTFQFFTDEEDPADYAARKLFQQMDDDLSTLSDDLYAELAAKNFSLRDMITLASLVEEESSVPGISAEARAQNQKDVAGVFWNRLTKDLGDTGLARRTMGSDTTDRYIEDWIARDYGNSWERVRDENPDLYNAYNTRDDTATREGLMVGPISSPSKTALEAALHPTDHNYFYFCNDLYGNHYYATYYWEHQNNIATMQYMNEQYYLEHPEEAADG